MIEWRRKGTEGKGRERKKEKKGKERKRSGREKWKGKEKAGITYSISKGEKERKEEEVLLLMAGCRLALP